MEDTAQIIIISIISVLTIILALVGIQVIVILRGIHRLIKTGNTVADNAKKVTSKLSQSSDSVSGVMTGVKTVASIINAVHSGTKGSSHEKKSDTNA
jgi:hypothetical protein